MTAENVDLSEKSVLKLAKDNQFIPFDIDLIYKELGDFGKFQLKNYLFICSAVIFYSAYTLSFVFTTGNLDYR